MPTSTEFIIALSMYLDVCLVVTRSCSHIHFIEGESPSAALMNVRNGKYLCTGQSFCIRTGNGIILSTAFQTH